MSLLRETPQLATQTHAVLDWHPFVGIRDTLFVLPLVCQGFSVQQVALFGRWFSCLINLASALVEGFNIPNPYIFLNNSLQISFKKKHNCYFFASI